MAQMCAYIGQQFAKQSSAGWTHTYTPHKVMLHFSPYLDPDVMGMREPGGDRTIRIKPLDLPRPRSSLRNIWIPAPRR